MKASTLMLVAATIATGCGATVHSTTSPNANLSQYRTYSFHSSPYKQGKETLADQEIRSALRQDLAAKGLTEARGGAPDFFVSYHVSKQQKLEVDDVGYDWGVFGGVDAMTYTEGTLVVDFVDANTNKAFWRGTASEAMDDPNNVDPNKLDKAIGKLVNQYPYIVASTPRPTM